jgi:Phage tail protein
VLTELKAYSSWRSAPTLPLSVGGRAETDLIQIRNIDGLNPVKASVNTSPFGSVDGASYVGSSVLARNIVLTLHPNPDWRNYTYESLRKLLYSYFMPKRTTKLIFYSDDMNPVYIQGVVEDVQVNMFSKDPELLVSIICPDPYFTALNPTVINGTTITSRLENSIDVDYAGNIETGIGLKVTFAAAQPPPTTIGILIGGTPILAFGVVATVGASMYFELSSRAMQKFVQNVTIGTGIITNLLSKVQEGSLWPLLQPGENDVQILTDAGVHDFELTYSERYGGL